MKPKTQTFNDGVVDICSVENISQPGNMPKDGLVLKIKGLRYAEKTVGMNRYWTALQNQAQITQMIRTQRINSVNVHDVAVLNGKQYDIVQIQYIQDIEPSCMDLSLQRLEVEYETN